MASNSDMNIDSSRTKLADDEDDGDISIDVDYRHYDDVDTNSVHSGSVCHHFANILRYIFPLLTWIAHYPIKKYFLYCDLWAGIYIGLYMIPQCK